MYFFPFIQLSLLLESIRRSAGEATSKISSIQILTARKQTLNSFIAEWKTKFNISSTACDALLSALRNHGHPDLPTSARTLMRTARNTKFHNMSDGVYSHTGIQTSLIACFCALKKEEALAIPNAIILDFNIDGINFSKSTSTCLWLIQMSIRGFEFDPCVVGTYFGKTKPKCNEFLKYFVDEISILLSNGMYFDNETIYIEAIAFCNDTPANSWIRGTKGHAGYSCCMRCNQKGQRLDSCLVFPLTKSALRTDYDFRSRIDPTHHIETSIIENIPNLDMIKSFAIDNMHIVHLGVVKKLVNFWIKSATKTQLKSIEARINTIEAHRPKEFHRTIRSIKDFKQFKAKEFRVFLLYTGPVLLFNILEPALYKNFITLHFAFRKLESKNCLKEIASIRLLLEKFVLDFKKLYGLNKLTYVVHNLIHLCDDVEHHGFLHSAYTFENNAGKIVKAVKHPRNVAQQIYNRSLERLRVISLRKKIPFELGRECMLPDKRIFFKRISINGLQFDSTKRNKWFLNTENKICLFQYAEKFNGKIIIIYKKLFKICIICILYHQIPKILTFFL